MQLYCKKRLGTIFVDEVHLFSTQCQFRPTFRQLPQLAFVPVPLVLLTATAPPWIISDLSKFFGPGRTPVIVKCSISEPLIRIPSTRMRRLYIHSVIQIHYMSLLYKFNQYLSGGRILVPVFIRVLDAIGLAG